MKYSIELLQEKDILSYKELIDECFETSNDIQKYRRYHQNDNYKIYVIKKDNIIVATATAYTIDLFTFEFQPCLMLFNVAVSEKCRKEKLATELLEYIVTQARKDGYKSISLTCLGSAYPAHKLYESVGFTKSGSVKYNLDLQVK